MDVDHFTPRVAIVREKRPKTKSLGCFITITRLRPSIISYKPFGCLKHIMRTMSSSVEKTADNVRHACPAHGIDDVGVDIYEIKAKAVEWCLDFFSVVSGVF